jgi:hypothetical protein
MRRFKTAQIAVFGPVHSVLADHSAGLPMIDYPMSVSFLLFMQLGGGLGHRASLYQIPKTKSIKDWGSLIWQFTSNAVYTIQGHGTACKIGGPVQ